MFKVGDKVIVKNYPANALIGNRGIVTSLDGGDYTFCVKIDGHWLEYHFAENELELVNNG